MSARVRVIVCAVAFIAALSDVRQPRLLAQAQGVVPTPESILGFQPGADYRLANYEQVVTYFQRVAEATDRVRLVQAGRSQQGRPYYFALVSTAENLRKIDRYREIAQRLAHPASLSPDEARVLVREGKAFVHIDGGLHSTEVAGPQHTPQLLYDLVGRAQDPEVAAYLNNVIVMIWPTLNPDGHSMVADHYMARVGTPNEAQAMSLPGLYQEYVGHDNNRDAYMLNTVESRVVEHTWRQWEPNIIYVQHQSSPFPTRIWLPPFAEPIATHAPGIVSSQLNMIGMAIAQRLNLEGKVGATHMGDGFDAWYPGYIDYNPVFKNIPAFWTETQGSGPSPRTSQPTDVPVNMRRAQALYVSPWLGGTWRMRDAVEYMTTAAMATIEYASKYKDALLLGRYQSGRDQIARGKAEAPFAYVVPREQRDPAAAVEMLRRLAFSGVRVDELTAPATFESETFPAGTWVIRTDQEFAAVAREVLDPQKYPDIRESPGGALETPYDAAGWTLPLQMGVRTVTVSQPIGEDVRSKLRALGAQPNALSRPVPYNMETRPDEAAFDSASGIGFDTNSVAKAIVPLPGRVTGTGASLAVSPAENNAFRAINRAWRAGASVRFDAAKSRYIISGLSPGTQDDLVRTFAIRGERTTDDGAKPLRPRVGLFLANTSMDEGWTRWVLDQYEFEYVRVSGADIQAGNLRGRVDVLIISDEARGVLDLGAGRGGRGVGAAGAAEPQVGNDQRLRALDEFVRGGGTLVCFNRSSNFAIEQLKLPVKNVIAGVNRQQFFVGGSLLNVNVETSHRVMAGMPARAAVFYDSGPVFETTEGFKGTILARYSESDPILASGFLQGEKLIQGKGAAVDVELGQGHVVLLGFRPQWRGQPFGTFRVIFNAISSAAAAPR
jgi:Zinc carboxypeptidase